MNKQGCSVRTNDAPIPFRLIDLDHSTAPVKPSGLQTYERNYRDEGIPDGMPHDNYALSEPLRPGRPDVVLPEHLQHHGARHPHGTGRHGRRQNQGGDEEHPEIPERVFLERDQLYRRRPPPPECRVEHHHDSQPEVRRCQADDGGGAPYVVGIAEYTPTGRAMTSPIAISFTAPVATSTSRRSASCTSRFREMPRTVACSATRRCSDAGMRTLNPCTTSVPVSRCSGRALRSPQPHPETTQRVLLPWCPRK